MMKVEYSHKGLERVVIGLNIAAAAVVIATFVCLFGFDQPLLPNWFLYGIQLVLLFFFIAEKFVRLFNAVSKKDFIRNFWFELPLLIILGVILFGSGRWFAFEGPVAIRHIAVGVYLVVQVISKLSRTVIDIAASGLNPTRTLIISFLTLIFTGAGFLMLPRSSAGKPVGFVDALFTATSATCVTGLVVKNVENDFSMMGKLAILTLIQLGGLGIVVFGAVFALLVGQAFSLRESAAMQDLLVAGTLSKINRMIVFIFGATVVIEGLGAVAMFGMWDNAPGWSGGTGYKWFASIFHSISAFCNAGLCLFSDNLVRYKGSGGIYLVLCPLIILGGLGFTVLYNLSDIAADKIKRFCKWLFGMPANFVSRPPKRMRLQTKIVLASTAILIIAGASAIYLFGQACARNPESKTGVLDAVFQSVTARTAGFNTTDIKSMPAPSQLVLMMLMFVGGSPGSTAGGIKTVTLAVVIMTVATSLRKRQEVEIFKRSIRLDIVGRAIVVMIIYAAVLLAGILLLGITERKSDFSMMQIAFEATSAVGTVGLSAGITTSLTAAGKMIIIVLMLVGRLGILTLAASLTFGARPARYNYPAESVMVG